MRPHTQDERTDHSGFQALSFINQSDAFLLCKLLDGDSELVG